ncbi:MAG: hypothetical protein IPP71_10045 [Bacteroidetes bacterium]|nr:hypothetical protein [Bacteroidota bacterium]
MEQRDYSIITLEIFANTIIKLHKIWGVSEYIEAAYKSLINDGFNVDSFDDLILLITFLKQFKQVYPEVYFTASNFKLDKNEFYIKLFQEGILPIMANERITEHIYSLGADQDKSEFIETLPQAQALKVYG